MDRALDLRAVEMRLAEVNRHRLRDGEMQAVADLEALLVHCRMLRAALYPITQHRLTNQMLARAATVLAQAQDD